MEQNTPGPLSHVNWKLVLPIIVAVAAMFGVGLGITGITAMTAVTDIGSTTPMLATMIGLAVGIDYTLFILARYRNELHHTKVRAHAAGIAYVRHVNAGEDHRHAWHRSILGHADPGAEEFLTRTVHLGP